MNIPRDEVETGNIHEPEANNCCSIITQVIIEVPRRWNCFRYMAAISDWRSKAAHTDNRQAGTKAGPDQLGSTQIVSDHEKKKKHKIK